MGATYGCHPHQVKSWADKEVFWDTLEILLPHKRSKCIAVGECGIDLNKCDSPLDQQRYAFRRQIQLAFKYDKALVIHCRSGPNRDAESECLQILEEELNRPGQH
ncbi:unnamed protein product [Caenorhabditis angaria]|uniref:Uncharacterized protein n=1 Tax=Caenorhabditis angaria TaxID=860376 RepID=A0A9P1I3Y3_9PELO|nr:unnamed protein product [Caenorhabditis angaria]